MSFNVYDQQRCVLFRAELCLSFWSRLRGYMFRTRPLDHTLVFPKCTMIHMFFVFLPLAVIVCDEQKQVLDVFRIAPWQVSRYYPRAGYMLETADMSILSRVRAGDILTF